MTTECAHEIEPVSDEVLADIRRQTRTGRPNGAWLEGVNRCAKCGSMEAKVSWYGQLHTTSVTQDGDKTVVHWPTRQGQSSGGGMGMGQ